MKLRNVLATLLLFPVLLAGCDDDPSGPVDEIYTLQSVRVEGRVSSLPALLDEGEVPESQGSTETTPYRYEIRRGNLLLHADGRYEFTGIYDLEFPEFDEMQTYVTVEEGTFTQRGDAITFDAVGESYLSPTGTRQNRQLTVSVIDPFEFFDDLTLTFGR